MERDFAMSFFQFLMFQTVQNILHKELIRFEMSSPLETILSFDNFSIFPLVFHLRFQHFHLIPNPHPDPAPLIEIDRHKEPLSLDHKKLMPGLDTQNRSPHSGKQRQGFIQLLGHQKHLVDRNVEDPFVKALELLEGEVGHFVFDGVLGLVAGGAVVDLEHVALALAIRSEGLGLHWWWVMGWVRLMIDWLDNCFN